MKVATPKLNNHYVIVVEVHKTESETFRVVGVVVYGFSRQYSVNAKGIPNCDAKDLPQMTLHHDTETTVTYTYDVRWKPSDISWGTRWDNYLHTYDPKIHWFR